LTQTRGDIRIRMTIGLNMKTTIRYLTLIAAAAATLWLTTGCNTVSISAKQDLGLPTYPPTDPAKVQILRTPPTHAHVRLGEITAEPSSESVPVTEIEAALRKAAAKMGADAAVVVYDKTQVTGTFVSGPWWGRSVETLQGRVIVAVAIKYQ
jgi:hypothetical protein